MRCYGAPTASSIALTTHYIDYTMFEWQSHAEWGEGKPGGVEEPKSFWLAEMYEMGRYDGTVKAYIYQILVSVPCGVVRIKSFA